MMNDKIPIFRFAPSPNGELHLGHAFSALLSLRLAREVDGKMLLRIEDIDTDRCTPEFESQMLRDLEWIGFEWDEEPLRQSEHFGEYREFLFRLEEKQLLYASAMSRREIKQRVAELEGSGVAWPHDPDGSPIYPGSERETPATKKIPVAAVLGEQVIRLDTKQAISGLSRQLTWQETGSGPFGETGTIRADPMAWGDVVLARRDTPVSYHLACTVDDARHGVTHIVRGMDLFHSTSVHRLLQELLELPEPEYHHHRLVLDDQQKKLSKSDKDTSLSQLRQSGVGKSQILSMIGMD
ncbi:MAG: tRNA glutamyl-Q(34) synthetase GluQRS [Rhizobiaceae bacterium]